MASEDITRANIVAKAEDWMGTPYLWGGNSKNGIDCSHFVYQVYRAAGLDYGYATTSAIAGSSKFKSTTTPRKGDLVLWSGHMGIVLDPIEGSFMGAQSEGVGKSNYKTNSYWKNRAGLSFYAWVGIETSP